MISKNHIATCQYEGFKRGAAYDSNGAKHFIQYLQGIGIITLRPIQGLPQPPLLIGFCQWMRQHRGVKEATLVAYRRIITDALRSIGEDPTRYDASALRAYVLDRAPKHGRSKAKLIVTTMRSFIRYLTAQGLCPVGLDAAIPTIAGWKLAALPRYLPATDVERIIASSDTTTPMGARDRLDAVRIFARYAKAEDSRHEVPPHGVYSRRRMPYRPFIFNTDQIRQVLEYAAQLPPVGSLRPWTYCTLFSLLAVTGMRISEALALRFEDVTPEGLLIQKTKFQKSRLLPLHPSAQIGLDKYLQRRRCFGGFDDHVFISLRQKPLCYPTVVATFVQTVRAIGLHPGPGQRGPRLHDYADFFVMPISI